MHLNATVALMSVAHSSTDIELLREKFCASYAEMESAYEGAEERTHTQKGPFCLQEIVKAAFQNLDLSDDTVPFFRAASLEIARRIEKGEDGTERHPYHNPLHIAKVIVNFRTLAALHNKMVEKGIITKQPKLSDSAIAEGILAAVAHDLKHDGRGNTVTLENGKSVHTMCRLEDQSVDTALSWLNTTTTWRPKTDALIHPMKAIGSALQSIYATDVSMGPSLNPSPAHYIRSWHDYFNGKYLTKPKRILNLSDKLDSITQSKARVLLASLLQDADTFSSVIDQDQHGKELERIMLEKQKTANQPPHALRPLPTQESLAAQLRLHWQSGLCFLKDMLNGSMTTEVANKFALPFIPDQIAIYQELMSARP